MKLKGICLLWLGIALPALCQTSNQTIDRLRSQLPTLSEDTSRVHLYLDIGAHYEGGNKTDSAIYFYQQAGKLSEKLKYPAGVVKSIAYYSEVLNHQGKYDQALKMNLKAVDIAQKNGLKLQWAKSLVNVAVSYQYKAEFETCLQYYLKAMPVFEELQFENGLYTLYANLCALYGQSLGAYHKALYYGDKALNLARKQDNPYGIASAQLNKGIVFTRLKKYPQALQVIQDGYQIGKQINNLYLQKTALANTGDIYLYQKQYSKVIPIAHEVLLLSKALKDPEGEVTALGGLASAHLHTKEFRKAKDYATRAVALCRTHHLRDELGARALQLAHIELALGNIAAYDALQTEGDSLEKAIMNKNLRLHLQELETKYESARKENQIKQLQKEQQIQRLTIRQKNTLNAIFIGFTLALLAVGMLFYRNAQKQKIISRQTQELQHQRIKELEQAQQLVAAHSMLQGQEAERRRLAKDLHDGLGSMLSGIKLSLSGMKSSLILSETEDARFSRALAQLDTTSQELRRVAHSMMPEALVRFGLASALHDFCSGLSRSAGLLINLQLFGLETRLDANTEIIIYRIVQELLNNVIKYAAATEVLVQLVRTDNTLALTVEDNGKGFDPAQPGPGIGLSNIRSRVDYLGGTLDIRSTPNEGTTVTIDFDPKVQEALV